MDDIDLSRIEAVYSGKDGRCCCGCSGKHTYASKYQKAAGERRGYEVTDDEVSDRTVKLIVNKIRSASPDQRQDNLEGSYRGYHAAVIGERLYIAYLTETPEAEEPADKYGELLKAAQAVILVEDTLGDTPDEDLDGKQFHARESAWSRLRELAATKGKEQP
jgi:hypothetical protein